MNSLSLTSEELLKRTTSRCPVCHAACPGEVWRVSGAPAKVFLKRTCAAHGEFSTCIASDARFYWLAKGNPENACCGGNGESRKPKAETETPCGNPQSQILNPQSSISCCSANGETAGTLGRNAAGHGEAPFEKLSTCLALIEIVRSCNLSCPTCYADSPVGTGKSLDAVPLDELQARIQGVIDRKGKIEILQLSGGEPTLHPQFFDLLDWAHANPGIDYLLLNTNGVRLANDAEFTQRLGAMFARGPRNLVGRAPPPVTVLQAPSLAVPRLGSAGEGACRTMTDEGVRPTTAPLPKPSGGGLQVYLQFDGVQEAGQHWLRGADLRETRQRAIARCAEVNIPITLAMTVTADNLAHLWDAIAFGLAHENIHGITFQPMFGSGRVTEKYRVPGFEFRVGSTTPDAQPEARNPKPETRLNTADILLAAVGQSAKKLRFEDFTPLPCGDPNCATIGYLIRYGGRTYSISDFVDFSRLQGFLKDKVHYTLEDLVQCGCENEPLGALLKQMELKSSMAFRIMVKPFMDAWTWDQDRIDRCCTHVIRPDGKLDSFCRYYSGFADVAEVP